MSSPGAEPPPAAGGPRSLRLAVRTAEALWFVGVPLALVFRFRLPFAETLGVFVIWLAVLLAIERLASRRRA